MKSVNATPVKVYVMLFVLVTLGYLTYFILRSLKNSSEVEHFMEENPDYKYRLEVMKVFDLYLNRNPSSEEIDKYSVLRNEQDILLTIMKDFNINASDIDQSKLSKYNVKVEEEYASEEPVMSNNDSYAIAKHDVILDDTLTKNEKQTIEISREKFLELRGLFHQLYSGFMEIGL